MTNDYHYFFADCMIDLNVMIGSAAYVNSMLFPMVMLWRLGRESRWSFNTVRVYNTKA